MWLLNKKPLKIFVLHNNYIPFGFQTYPAYCYQSKYNNTNANNEQIIDKNILELNLTICNHENNIYKNQKFVIL